MRRAAALLFMAATASAARQWCVGPAVSGLPALSGDNEFRGSFRDLALYIHSQPTSVCRGFRDPKIGNDGLWILEYDFAEEMEATIPVIKAAGMQIWVQQNRTLVVEGGELLPEILGVDACGAEKHKRVISVSPLAVRPIEPYTEEEKAKIARSVTVMNTAVQNAISLVTATDMAGFITNMESYNSRNSYTGSDLVTAANWLTLQYQAYNATTQRHTFRTDMAAQVFAEFPGQGPNPQVLVVGAHYDSRSTQVSNPTQRAPGADDNGTGSAALVMLAKLLQQSRIRLTHTLRLMSFTGEEQGLLGSRAIAQQYRASGVELLGMINADMLGYRQPGTPLGVAYVNRFMDAEFTNWGKSIVAQYVPELTVGNTAGCCSDQQSFQENGYRSLGIFETPTSSVVYPHYHQSTDLLQYLDIDQIVFQAKALAATALVMAEPLDS